MFALTLGNKIIGTALSIDPIDGDLSINHIPISDIKVYIDLNTSPLAANKYAIQTKPVPDIVDKYSLFCEPHELKLITSPYEVPDAVINYSEVTGKITLESHHPMAAVIFIAQSTNMIVLDTVDAYTPDDQTPHRTPAYWTLLTTACTIWSTSVITTYQLTYQP
jgi:hypothetical protein